MLWKIEQRQVAAICEAFAPSGGPGLAPRAGEVDFVGPVSRMLAASTFLARIGIHLAIVFATFAPLWILGRFRTFASLPMGERVPLLRRLLSHRIFAVRELSLLLKIGASMALLGTPSVRARSNYDRKRVPPKARALPVIHEAPARVSEVA